MRVCIYTYLFFFIMDFIDNLTLMCIYHCSKETSVGNISSDWLHKKLDLFLGLLCKWECIY